MLHNFKHMNHLDFPQNSPKTILWQYFIVFPKFSENQIFPKNSGYVMFHPQWPPYPNPKKIWTNKRKDGCTDRQTAWNSQDLRFGVPKICQQKHSSFVVNGNHWGQNFFQFSRCKILSSIHNMEKETKVNKCYKCKKGAQKHGGEKQTSRENPSITTTPLSNAKCTQ